MTDQPIRIGIIGLGNMGQVHIKNMPKIKGAVLGAVADSSQERREQYTTGEYSDVQGFDDAMAMIQSDACDAIMIVVPHFLHPPLAIAGLENGKHVLVEKPVAVTTKAALEVHTVHDKHPDLVYAGMFNQRSKPAYRKLKAMLDGGELGALHRISWTITDWYRSQAYYNSGGWRATWRGEGGGVLINQCPHNLDLFSWFFGEPETLWAVANLGKHHEIEVEDDVNALMKFKDGHTATFATSTGMYPGVNRLEIEADMGRVIIEDGKTFTFTRNAQGLAEYTATTEQTFDGPETETTTETFDDEDPGHTFMLQNFVDAIRNGTELIAPAESGVGGLALGNAMLYAGLTQQPVSFPLDPNLFADKLDELQAQAPTIEKKVVETKADMSSSFK